MADIPEIDNCCDKETYAFYGLAAYWAQVLESGALNLAIVLKLPDVNLVTQELFEELYANLTRRTLGQLLNQARNVIDIAEADQKYLDEALELRNLLVHHYFRNHAEDFVSEVGRTDMKKELQDIISKFRNADKLLDSIYLPLWEKYGVTEEFIENELTEMRKRVEHRDRGT